jgi:hypothetical protein
MVMRSLQPLWEGLGAHAWNTSQLAAFQQELAGFNLLADYTNSVRRVVLAYIEIWRSIPRGAISRVALPASDGGYLSRSGWDMQPRGWWFENCIQLHRAGQIILDGVDGTSGRIRFDRDWSDLNGLPLDPPARDLLQQWPWWGPNPALVSFAQTSLGQAIIACALEKHRLANGGYPEALQELVPALLDRVPNDAISGRPIIYEKLAAGDYILRGVGPNGTDDRKTKPSDDWLWTFKAPPSAARKPGAR